jgi:hypothetical protein
VRTVESSEDYDYIIQHQCKAGRKGKCDTASHNQNGGWYDKVVMRSNIARDQARERFEDTVREAPRATYRLIERVVISRVTEDVMEHHDGISLEDYRALDPKHYHHEGCYQHGCMLRSGEGVEA